MKKRITIGIGIIACVALCAAVWPLSAEVGDLPAEPEKAAVTAECAARSEETQQILLYADTHTPESELVAKSEPAETEIMAEEKTEPMPPVEPAPRALSKSAPVFAAPAKKLADRDAWIGWTDLERRRFRYRLLGNSRFLILPGVQVPHLASHVLAIAVRRLRADWSKRYGYAPVLLETFVTPPHKGTCYRAANWSFIGETASTDRYNRKRRANGSIKMIFAYPLVRNWRAQLCAPAPVAGEEGDFYE